MVTREAAAGPRPVEVRLDAAAWDDVVRRTAAPHLLQSSDWGEIKSRWGWSVTRLIWGEADAPSAVAQVLTRRVGGTPLVAGYVPKGPLLSDPVDAELWSVVLGDLARWSGAAGVTWMKIDPDVPRDDSAVADAWSRAGWQPSDAQVQFPTTMLSDLAGDEETLLAAMKSKTRYNIGLARRRGVTVRRGGEGDFAAFFGLYAQTGSRAGFGIRSAEYYQDVWRTLLRRGRAVVILAELEGRPLAGVIPVRFGRTAWYLYGASGDAGREHMPAYLAQWDSIRWAMEQGCERYDWWGGPSVLDESDPLWGVYRFKLGFGARLAPSLGAWDLPVQRARYRLFRRMERWRRALIAARR